MKNPPNNKQDVYWIKERAQLAALVSSRRQAIGDLLACCGPLSAKEIASGLGMKASAIYHHLDVLLHVGLIREVDKRQVRSRIEILYDIPGKLNRLGISLKDESFRDLWVKYNAAQCRQTDRDFSRGLALDHVVESGSQKNLRTFRLIGSPDKKTLAKINQKLEEVAQLLANSSDVDGEHDLVALSCVMAPLEKADV